MGSASQVQNAERKSFCVNEVCFDAIQRKAKQIRNNISISSPDLDGRNRILYVSESGDDGADGLSPKNAWKTIQKVNGSARNGDAVLFQCGGKWRGSLEARDGALYSHYGEGELPILCGSKRDYADPALWESTTVACIYRCTERLNNVGIIAFDHDGSLGNYDAKVATTVAVEGKKEYGLQDLKRDLYFWNDRNSGELFLYSEKGNPGTRFRSIEIGEGKTVIGLTGNNIVVDGLRVQYSGNFGISSGDISGATVKNCIVEWIGGSQNGAVGGSVYGNGIQLYGSVTDCVLENNWCYQCFDTGITIQYAGRKEEKVMENVSISDNLVEYCHWGIEYYNLSETGRFADIRIDHNLIRFNGMGWGEVDRLPMCNGNTYLAEQTASLCCFGIKDDSENVFVRENILQLSNPGSLIRVDNVGFTAAKYEGNRLIQKRGALLAKLGKDRYFCNEKDAQSFFERIGDDICQLCITDD